MPNEDQDVSSSDIHQLSRDVGEMKTLMARMTEAITRITILDERQQVVAGFMEKLDERMGRMEQRQHEAEIAAVTIRSSTSRTDALELSFRELHIDRERSLARFQTAMWMIRGLWAVVGFLGIGGIVAIARAFPGAGV